MMRLLSYFGLFFLVPKMTYAGACVHDNPTLVISPNSSQTVGPGKSMDYKITVTNNDSPNCPVSSFVLMTSIAPSTPELSVNLPPSQSTFLLQPGESTTVSAVVKSTVNAPIGVYQVEYIVKNTQIHYLAAEDRVVIYLKASLD